jgi:aryl-alcohol dehydrogenase-like predicted oxidoreductase
MMDTFAAAGGNFIDSARVYADWLPGGHGASETAIGNWLSGRPRDKMAIATKGAHPDLKTMDTARMSKADIAADITESLRCLQTDYIDLYWLHRDDVAKPVADIIGTMEQFVQSGMIHYYGCSNWTTPRIAEALAWAKAGGVKGFVGDQPLWSLARMNDNAIGDKTLVQMSPELYELHKRTGLAAFPYSSQAKGFFTKFTRDGERLAGGMKKRFWNDANLARAKMVVSLAKELKVPVAAIPLAYLTSQPFVTIPIIGPRNVAQLTESLAAADMVLSSDIVEGLRTPI